MTSNSSPDSSGLSEARLAANRANAMLSCGPKTAAGKTRARLNALKHGLTGRIAWPGQYARRNQEFFQCAWARLGPRNPLEEICVANLLQSRLKEDFFLDVERTVLTRRPLSFTPDDGRPYTFLHEPAALEALEQLTRHLTHLTRASAKDVLALLRVRQENWEKRMESAAATPPVEEIGAPEHNAEGATLPEGGQAAASPVDRGNLEDCLADRRLILPEEDATAYAALATELWATLQPANTLEGFVACDFIKTQWRLDCVLVIQSVLLRRSAISASGQDCGFGFAFVHDSQRGQALETLRHYEAALRRRLGERMALWRRLRKEGWADAILPGPHTRTEDLPSGPLKASSPPVAPGQPASGPMPDPLPTPISRTPSVDPSGPAPGVADACEAVSPSGAGRVVADFSTHTAPENPN
jgi:hypothetical protein